MAEEFEDTQEEQNEGKSLWEILQQEQDGDSSEEYEEEQEEQDQQIAKQDKLEKKLSAKMDNMTKKFEQNMLRERITRFEGEADELTLDMFRTVAADVKSVEEFDRTLAVINKQAAELRKKADAYRESLEKQAAEQTAAAWGTGPLGTPVKRGEDDIKKQQEAIEKGDSHAALAALLEGDKMVDGIF